MKLFVTRKKAKNSEGTYVCLVLDLGYRSVILSYDRALCAEVLDVPPSKLETIKLGQTVPVSFK